jgi:hypothetical protein
MGAVERLGLDLILISGIALAHVLHSILANIFVDSTLAIVRAIPRLASNLKRSTKERVLELKPPRLRERAN